MTRIKLASKSGPLRKKVTLMLIGNHGVSDRLRFWRQIIFSRIIGWVSLVMKMQHLWLCSNHFKLILRPPHTRVRLAKVFRSAIAVCSGRYQWQQASIVGVFDDRVQLALVSQGWRRKVSVPAADYPS